MVVSTSALVMPCLRLSSVATAFLSSRFFPTVLLLFCRLLPPIPMCGVSSVGSAIVHTR